MKLVPEANLDAVGCGSMVVDLFYRAPRIIGAEEKIVLEQHRGSTGFERAQVGGLTLNHLGWARVLGLRAGIFGKMGDDRHGAFLRAGMDELGIEHHLTLDGSASSFAMVFVDRAGDRAIYMARGATGELAPAEIKKRHGKFIRRGRFVSTEISQLPLRTVIAVLLFARAHSIPTVLDVDIPPSDAAVSLGTRAEFDRALRLATILKPAKAAARELAGVAARSPLKTAEALRSRYQNRAVIITEGERGCTISADDAAIHVPAFRVKQIDATGAGDAFLGAMLAGLRWNLGWRAIGRLANAAGAVCVQQLGAFPSGFEVRDRIEALYGESIPGADFRDDSKAARGETSARSTELEKFFDIALEELASTRRSIDSRAILRTVDLIRNAQARGGRVHVTGVGKPEHIARYAASLFSSIGTPATFLHATEVRHGSLGQVHPEDVVVAISNSGSTYELCAAAELVREQGAKIVAITGNRDSDLARLADAVVDARVAREGGGLGLAPRASVMAQVMVIAAISVALEVARGLTAAQYSRWHRAGALGDAARKLSRKRA